MKKLAGIAASRGICIGPAFQFIRQELVVEERKIKDSIVELKKLDNAIREADRQISEIYEEALSQASNADAQIFQAHKLILYDPELLNDVKKLISEKSFSADFSVMQTARKFSEIMAAMADEYFSARATDIMDVGSRLVRILLNVSELPTENLQVPSVICSEDLTPSDTVLLDKTLVLGFCTAKGSATSHAAILARGLGIPAVAGAGDNILKVIDGTNMIVDGTLGEIFLKPLAGMVAEYQNRIQASETILAEALKHASNPATTKDGLTLEIVANIGNVEDAEYAVKNGAEGVGLLRTEFLYLERTSMPSEDELYRSYRAILDVFGDRPVILRTLDVGGDKEIPYMNLAAESNSFLGQRALRLCLVRPDIFKPQLRAALRAGLDRNLKIMFPMVATASEVREARKVLEECEQELKDEGILFAENIEIGIMVEIPSAAVIADQLSKEVDFFSIGTNDLSQYTMAADRTNPKVADLTNAFYPAVLRLVRDVITAAHADGKWVGMCGELAGEPLAAPLLLGLGLDEFSMGPPMVPVIKQILRELDAVEMRALAAEALKLETPEDIQEFVKQKVPFIKNLVA